MTQSTPSILSEAAALCGGLYPAKRLVSWSSQAYKRLRMLNLFQPIAGMAPAGAALKRFEPCVPIGSGSRTVLRGAWAG